LIEKKLEITVQVSCLFYFLLSRFFKRKVKSGFFGGFYWTLKKKTWVRVFYNNPNANATGLRIESWFTTFYHIVF